MVAPPYVAVLVGSEPPRRAGATVLAETMTNARKDAKNMK